VTKDEFLANPIVAVAHGRADIPREWIAVAWQQPLFREYITDLTIRSVVKTGTPGLAVEWLELLPGALSGQQIAELYVTIKEGTERSETEWRPDFESLFPNNLDALPTVDIQREIDNTIVELIFYIGLRRIVNVRAAVNRIVINKWDRARIRIKTDILRAIPECNRLLQQLSLDGEEEVTLLQIATLLGDEAIVEVLTDAGLP
jgi:hypothetical protein